MRPLSGAGTGSRFERNGTKNRALPPNGLSFRLDRRCYVGSLGVRQSNAKIDLRTGYNADPSLACRR